MTLKKLTKLTLLLLSLVPIARGDSSSDCGCHRAHHAPNAPISVMGDHTHHKGGWMLSYRFMRMDMDGMRSGKDRFSTSEVFAADGGYTVTPTEMVMEMHMLGAMYAPTHDLTLMLMTGYVESEMDHRINPAAAPLIAANGGSDSFTTRSEGFSDTRVSALYRFYSHDSQSAHMGLGLSLPTGSIDEEDNTPRPGRPPTFPKQQLPASMQLGSGTFDLLPSITWTGAWKKLDLGAQAKGIIRLESENDNGYQLGDVFEANIWASHAPAAWWSLQAGLSYRATGTLDGDQDGVGQAGPAGRSVTTAFGENYGGDRIDGVAGLRLNPKSGTLRGHSIAVDLRLPLWQDLNGVQLETDSVLTIGWTRTW